MSETASQRIDRWLWYARIFKSRALAAKAVRTMGIRITRNEQTQTTEKTNFGVRNGDTLTFARGTRIMVLEVIDLGTRRGPAKEAQALYTDHSPPLPPKVIRPTAPAARELGTGRPTKKERRALDALKGDPNTDAR